MMFRDRFAIDDILVDHFSRSIEYSNRRHVQYKIQCDLRHAERKNKTLNPALQANYLRKMIDAVNKTLPVPGKDLESALAEREPVRLSPRKGCQVLRISCLVKGESQLASSTFSSPLSSRTSSPRHQQQKHPSVPQVPRAPPATADGTTSRRQTTQLRVASAAVAHPAETDSDHDSAMNGPIYRITNQQVLLQAELDFGMLSYGKPFIDRRAVDDLSSDHQLETYHRKVPAYEFKQYMAKHKLGWLSFPQYLHIIGGMSIHEAVTVIRRWATSFAWACELTEEQARNSLLLWNKWTCDGERPFTLAVYLDMIRDCELRTAPGGSGLVLGSSLARSVAEQERMETDKVSSQRNLFALADQDNDGVLSKSEFATLFSGLLVPASSSRLPQIPRRR